MPRLNNTPRASRPWTITDTYGFIATYLSISPGHGHPSRLLHSRLPT
ncbi:hypothetical protein V494_03962, partial [Pseudogymnoascus sp. VKM F-4513 (FW-928)]